MQDDQRFYAGVGVALDDLAVPFMECFSRAVALARGQKDEAHPAQAAQALDIVDVFFLGLIFMPAGRGVGVSVCNAAHADLQPARSCRRVCLYGAHFPVKGIQTCVLGSD